MRSAGEKILYGPESRRKGVAGAIGDGTANADGMDANKEPAAETVAGIL